MNSKVWILVLIAIIFFVALAQGATVSKPAAGSGSKAATTKPATTKPATTKAAGSGSKAATTKAAGSGSKAATTKAAGSGSKAATTKAAATGSKAAPAPAGTKSPTKTMLYPKLIAQMTSSGLLVKMSVRNQGPLAAVNVKARVNIASAYDFTLFRKEAIDKCTYIKATTTVECTPTSPLEIRGSFRYRFVVSGPFDTTAKQMWNLKVKADNSDEFTSGLMLR